MRIATPSHLPYLRIHEDKATPHDLALLNSFKRDANATTAASHRTESGMAGRWGLRIMIFPFSTPSPRRCGKIPLPAYARSCGEFHGPCAMPCGTRRPAATAAPPAALRTKLHSCWLTGGDNWASGYSNPRRYSNRDEVNLSSPARGYHYPLPR